MSGRVVRMPRAGKPKLPDHLRDVMRRKQVASANFRAAFLVASVTLLLLGECWNHGSLVHRNEVRIGLIAAC